MRSPEELEAKRQQREAELLQQQQYCAAVREQSLRAAEALVRSMCADDAAGAEALEGSLATVEDAIAELSRIHAAQQGSRLGSIAMTDFCNALLNTNALDTLNALQQDADLQVAAEATALFQAVVPRIWAI